MHIKYSCDERYEARYRKTPNISPRLIQSHKHFLVGLYLGEWGLIFGWVVYMRNHFGSGVFYTCYLYLKKGEWNKTKKQCSCSKIPFYHFTVNKTRDVFPNSGPLDLFRLKNTWGGTLNSVDLIKIILLQIFFLCFFLGGGLIYGTTVVL